MTDINKIIDSTVKRFAKFAKVADADSEIQSRVIPLDRLIKLTRAYSLINVVMALIIALCVLVNCFYAFKTSVVPNVYLTTEQGTVVPAKIVKVN
ncbi:hypothetical protein [Neptuniibacter sp. QD37_11]|uniref:hypothetical protein n=1 Tax=Neptuniibacter sp. QD37_11 TaxID=3398209 RepID=UPI0039F5DA14